MLKIGALRLVITGAFVVTLTLSGYGQKAVAARGQAGNEPMPTLLAYVGGQLRDPFQRLAAMYQKKTGVKVRMIFNNCGFLLGQLETSRRGDIFLAGNMAFVRRARQQGAVAEVSQPLAYHVPVIVTPKGNPAGITGIRDLARPGIRLLMPDTRATAIGRDVMKTCNKLGITAQVEHNIIADLATPAQVLAAMLMGEGNAAVVSYNALLKARGKIHVVPIDPKVNVVGTVRCVVLSFSKQLSQAKDFAAFLAINGPRVFAADGFQTKF